MRSLCVLLVVCTLAVSTTVVEGGVIECGACEIVAGVFKEAIESKLPRELLIDLVIDALVDLNIEGACGRCAITVFIHHVP
jgi:hypothetical protein